MGAAASAMGPAADPLAGRVLDRRYQVRRRLARGGMATVYEAVDLRLDRGVAVKVMHPALAADDDFVARFRREAKAAARLAGPHVVAVTDQGCDGDTVFLVMELIEGRTLRDVLRERGSLSAAQALEVLEPVLAALAAAHRAGLVHRDVKPENVLLGDDGSIKVADFGLARAVDASPLSATAGILLGTVAYVAPEQVERRVSDARTDVYAAGIVLFEMVTGRPPFDGESALSVAYQHLNDTVPAPSSLNRSVPPVIDDLVLRATARDPDLRPMDAASLLAMVRLARRRLPEYAGEARRVADVAEVAEAAEDRGTNADDQFATTAIPIPRFGQQAGPADTPGDTTAERTRYERTTYERTAPDEAGPGDSGPDADTGTLPAPGGARRRPWRRPRTGTVVALLVVLLTALVGYGGWYLATGNRTRVPPVAGLAPAAASAVLSRSHLASRLEQGGAYSETVPKGDVAATEPAAGDRVRRGASIGLRVSIGPERYGVPTLPKLTLADATTALRIAHLTVGPTSSRYDDTVPQGSVLASSPAAQTLAKPGQPVALVLSQGPAPVTAPDVAGQPADAARTALERLSLQVQRATANSDTVPLGSVISLAPATSLHRRQKVMLTVSLGPELVQVPNVYGQSADQAQATLERAGFKVRVLRPLYADGVVVAVRPGGSRVAHGSTITIVVV